MDPRLQAAWQKVRSALFSNVNKELLIFLFFVAVSAAFWFMQSLNEDYEQTIDIPVGYRNVPENVVITSNSPEVIKVTLRDKGFTLLNYRLRGGVQPVVFDFEHYEGMGYLIRVTNAEIQKQLTDNLSGSTKLISFKPENFEVVYTRGKAKKVPVVLAGTISAKPQYEITELRTIPDSVIIYAPQETLDTISSMRINSVSYHDLTDSLSFQADLRSLTNVKAIPSKVDVKVLVEQLTEKTLEVPVDGVNVPEGKNLRFFPAKVKVTFQTVLSYYKYVTANNFIIQVDYADILHHSGTSIKPTVLAPSIIKHLRMSPQEVDYLVEETDEAPTPQP